MIKRPTTLSEQLQNFESEISRLEGRILELEVHLEKMIDIERNHLLRVKNQEEISDEFIIQGKCYQDLSPDKAWKLYNRNDFNFILIDVSSVDYRPLKKIPEALHIPWSQFSERFLEIQSRAIPILVICEDGTHSILACEFLVRHGFYNCNNISGGYKFWRGNQFTNINGESA